MKKIIYKIASFFSKSIRRKQRTETLLNIYIDHLNFDDIDPNAGGFDKQGVFDRINKKIDTLK